MHLVRTAWISAASGLGAGIIWAMGARLAMRIIALVADKPTNFSVGGTLLILVVGACFGIPLGYPFYLGPLKSESVLGYQWLAMMLFGGLFIVFGLAFESALTRLDRRVPVEPRRLSTVLGVVALTLACSFELYVLAAMITNGFQ